MTLDDFEQIIDQLILERGLHYYQNDQILSIEQIDRGLWEATVQGSQNYDVTVQMINNIISKSNCTCPFNLSDYCKHQVAIFNFIKYSPLAKKEHSGKIQEIQNIIDGFSQTELKSSFLNILKNHRFIRKDFLNMMSDNKKSD